MPQLHCCGLAPTTGRALILVASSPRCLQFNWTCRRGDTCTFAHTHAGLYCESHHSQVSMAIEVDEDCDAASDDFGWWCLFLVVSEGCRQPRDIKYWDWVGSVATPSPDLGASRGLRCMGGLQAWEEEGGGLGSRLLCHCWHLATPAVLSEGIRRFNLRFALHNSMSRRDCISKQI